MRSKDETWVKQEIAYEIFNHWFIKQQKKEIEELKGRLRTQSNLMDVLIKSLGYRLVHVREHVEIVKVNKEE